MPSHWLQFCRILRTAIKLQNCDAPLHEVARSLGYPDGFTLSNQMDRLVGIRPSLARERLGWEWVVEAWLQLEGRSSGLEVPLPGLVESGDRGSSQGSAAVPPRGPDRSDAPPLARDQNGRDDAVDRISEKLRDLLQVFASSYEGGDPRPSRPRTLAEPRDRRGGIGKTRLVREALARAPFDGLRVLQRTCSDFEQTIPLSPILRSLTPDWVGHAIHEVGHPWDSILLPLLPELWQAGRPESPAFRGQAEEVPSATREAFLRLFTQLADTDPLVVFLDDFHWVDRTSLSVLEHLRGRWTGRGLVLVLALRPAEVRPTSPLGSLVSIAFTSTRSKSLLAASNLNFARYEYRMNKRGRSETKRPITCSSK